MTVSAPPGYVKLSAVFKRLEEWYPPSATPTERPAAEGELDQLQSWEEASVGLLVDAMTAIEGATITLVHDKEDATTVSPSALLHMPPSWARAGGFFVFNERLSALKHLDLAEMYLEPELASKLRASLTKLRASAGRPPHAAKAWYAAQNFERRGRAIGELQNEMAAATREKPPAYTTIRSWERSKHK